MDTADEVDRLIRLLDSDTFDANGMGAADAQWELTALGRETDVVAPLLRALPGFGRFAQLCAIEIFQELQDKRAVGALVELLAGDDTTVREWAAEALADFPATEAVPALRRAWAASKQRGDDPAEGEPWGLRLALTTVRVRVPVLPELAPTVRVGDVEAWSSAWLGEVLDELAARDQVTLSFGLWRSEDDGHYYGEADFGHHAELDFAQPWPELVRQAHHQAREAARRVEPRGDLVAAISWIAQTDL